MRTSRGCLGQVIIDCGKADAKGRLFLTLDIDHLAGAFGVSLGHLQILKGNMTEIDHIRLAMDRKSDQLFEVSDSKKKYLK